MPEERLTPLGQNLRFAVRSLLRSPGFFAVAVLTLALGIGTNTAIFSIVNALLVRPYPYREPDRLVLVRSVNPKIDESNGDISLQDFRDLREQSEAFEDAAAIRLRRYNLASIDEPVRVRGAQVSASLFPLLGGRPLAGRTFAPAEDTPGAEKVVVLTEPLWQRAFGSDPAVVGRTITLDGQPATVVGVVPPAAQFPDTDAAELFVPLALDPAASPRDDRDFLVLARLAPGVSVPEAESQVEAAAQRLAQVHPDTNASWGARVMTLRDFRTRRFRSLSVVLLGVVGLVLLIACVNVANLLLQRAAVRQREIAIRSAMGANRSRVVTQLLTESLVLAVLGGGLGLLLSMWGLKLLVRSIPQQIPSYLNDFGIDGRVLAFMLGISLLTAMLFGLVPALRLSRPNLVETLGDAGARASGGVKAQRLRTGLVVLEVALSVMLLVAAGLMTKSFQRLQNVDPGFQPAGAVVLEVTLPRGGYSEPHQKVGFVETVLERLGAVPGVQAVGFTDDLPIGDPDTVRYTVAGQSAEQGRENPEIGLQVIGGDYFGAMGIPLLRGRGFGRADAAPEAAPAVIVNARLAEVAWPGAEAVGQRLKVHLEEETWMTVVGVAADVRARALADERVPPEIYVPYTVLPGFDTLSLTVRAAGDPLALAPALRAEVRRVDADLPVTDIRTFEVVLARALWLQRFSSVLFTVFAVVALLLAAVGIYGTVAYSVAQRRREIGIRMALGARAADVVRLVVRQGMAPVAAALVLGLIGAFALGRAMRRLLFEVGGTDPAVFVGVTLLIATVALVASYVPARRATRVPPVSALKLE